MPLGNNKVGDDSTVGANKASADGKTLVDSLVKVVACYRQLASCVGGSTDSLQLRDELRQTREKAQTLAVSICHHLTRHLRDRNLPSEQRKEMELLWVTFSSCLELHHVDMCKVLKMSELFALANAAALVKTGVEGGVGEVAARALSVADLNPAQNPALPNSLEHQERSATEQEISQIDHMIEDMETKVNVMRWMVEPLGPQYPEPLSRSNSASLALLSVDEEEPGPRPLCQQNRVFVLFLLCLVILVAATLSACIVFFS
ncbi:regulator of G-protein signaling 9-binding protein [Synchiropus splendidus]|uniref:regulator of G-protein signaling 9-binding protein n=1 Tax=Synchiropus splendidus TaxID=270530 RepID=UPI00237E9D1B|nr:regulator of G-protein signaling 9-binding protein [Synchiropus splendidus]